MVHLYSFGDASGLRVVTWCFEANCLCHTKKRWGELALSSEVQGISVNDHRRKTKFNFLCVKDKGRVTKKGWERCC